MAENKFQRVEEDDPKRCQAVVKHGQCPYKAVDGQSYCPMHGGNTFQTHRKIKASHDYQLQDTIWQQRVNDFSSSPQIKNLRGEIGILKAVCESILVQIKVPAHVPLFADKIQSVVRDIKALVEVCQKIEERNKELLSKTEVFNIADAVISIVSDVITDPDQLIEIGERLYDTITGIASGTNPAGDKSKVDN